MYMVWHVDRQPIHAVCWRFNGEILQLPSVFVISTDIHPAPNID